MKAVLLCAGFGTRLGVLTENCPKPMLQVAGIPIVERQILALKKIGVSEFYLNLHYLGDQIKKNLGDGERLGVQINYCWEESPTGTAGGVKIFEEELVKEESFLVLYGDIVTDEDLSNLIKFHSEHKASASILSLIHI